MGDFAGRSLPAPGFAGDGGTADPGLAAALAVADADPARRPEVLAALHTARVLTPVRAVLAEGERRADGLVRDKTSDMALPLLVAADGATAVPVFSSLTTLAAWDPGARPVPVEGVRAAAVALAERAEAIVVDVAGPHPATLGPAEMRALVEGRCATPAYDDDAVRVGLHRALAAVAGVRRAWIAPCAGVDGRLSVEVEPGADARTVGSAVAAAVHDVVRRGTARGLDLALLPPGAPAPSGAPAPALEPPGRPVYTR